MGPTGAPPPAPDPAPDGPDEAGPPPDPYARIVAPGGPDAPTVHRAQRPKRRGRRVAVVLVVLTSLAAGFVAGLAASDVVDVPDALRSRAAVQAEQDRLMVELLEDVVRSEGIMLAFDDQVAAVFEQPQEEAAVLAAVGEAAAAAAEELAAVRPVILSRTGGEVLDDVRDVYVPHLDAWAEYLTAVGDEPGLLFDAGDQQPYLLRINATADEFRLALEALLSRGPSAAVAGLAERILEDGFRGEGPPGAI